MRLLLSAYACIPGRGSEPGTGWNWVQQMSRFHKVTVITREANRQEIEAELRQRPIANVTWLYFDLPKPLRFWKKGRRGTHPYYYLWQIGAYWLARRQHRAQPFDLVQHVTFVKYWLPNFLWMLNCPYLLGPVGGGENTPYSFWPTLGMRGGCYEAIRSLGRWLAERDPFVRRSVKRAAICFVTSPETAERVRHFNDRLELLSQVGLPQSEIHMLESLPHTESAELRVVSIGNLLHLKGYHLALPAIARFLREYPHARYSIIGSGPEEKRLKRLAASLDIADRVSFLGQLPRADALQAISNCDLLLHTALHDSGGYVSVESMAAGVPVVCLDLGGSAVLVSDTTGIKVPAIDPEQSIRDLAAALLYLARDPQLRARMGAAGRQRVREQFSWQRKGELLNEVYSQILRESPAATPVLTEQR